jgi:hypothetical protein
MLTDRR